MSPEPISSSSARRMLSTALGGISDEIISV
jgi:hypothetical protein